VQAFEGVLAAGKITVSGPIADGETTSQVSYFVVEKATGAVLGRFVLPSASLAMHSFRLQVDVAALVDAYDAGVFGPDGLFRSSNFTVEAPPHGAIGAAA
jgi:hypothetical protein